MTMKNDVNIEKYHLTKRDLEIVYLLYKKTHEWPRKRGFSANMLPDKERREGVKYNESK